MQLKASKDTIMFSEVSPVIFIPCMYNIGGKEKKIEQERNEHHPKW